MVHEPDLRSLDADAIMARFAATSSGRLVLTRLVRAVIEQAHERIVAGLEPPIRGNIRTLWYRWLKPVVAALPVDALGTGDAYEVLIDQLARMVQAGAVSYTSFGFTDENWENRRIGVLRPQVLVFAEKTGWIQALLQLHRELDVSVLALGGKPSLLSSEYTARDVSSAMQKSGVAGQVHLLGLVDWDPDGAIVARSFAGQLAGFGLPVAPVELLLRPERFGTERLGLFARPLRNQKRAATWLAEGGGIGGEALGLSTEAMAHDELLELARRRIAELAPEAAAPVLPRQKVSVRGWSAVLGGESDPGVAVVDLRRLDDLASGVVADARAGERWVVVDDLWAVAAVVPVELDA